MTTPIYDWRLKSLDTLENYNWGNPVKALTNLVRRCIGLSKVSIDNFTLSDLRVMIGQKFGLKYLIPLAIEKLQDNIFLDTEFYEGDLLENILKMTHRIGKITKIIGHNLTTLLKKNEKS